MDPIQLLIPPPPTHCNSFPGETPIRKKQNISQTPLQLNVAEPTLAYYASGSVLLSLSSLLLPSSSLSVYLVHRCGTEAAYCAHEITT